MEEVCSCHVVLDSDSDSDEIPDKKRGKIEVGIQSFASTVQKKRGKPVKLETSDSEEEPPNKRGKKVKKEILDSEAETPKRHGKKGKKVKESSDEDTEEEFPKKISKVRRMTI